MNRQTPAIAAALLFLAEISVAGAPPDESPADIDSILEEIVVEATRAGLTAADITVNTSILSQLDVLESAYKPADEILRQIPGFSLLRSADSIAAAPTTSTVSLRGLGGSAASRTLVLLDGIPVHSPYSTEVFWARIPRHRIDHIEVIRGGGANAWGNLSLGGVISIVTVKPDANRLSATGMAGYPGTADFGLGASHVSDDWVLSGYADYYTTDGYMNIPQDQRGPVDEPVHKDHWNVSGGIERVLEGGTRFFLNAGVFHETRHGGSALDVNETEIATLDAGLDFQSERGDQWKFRMYYENSDLEDASVRIHDDKQGESLRSFEHRPADILGAGLVWSRSFDGSHDVSAGADYRWADVLVDEWSRYNEGEPGLLLTTDSRQDIGGVFIQDVWRMSDRWQANGSLRYDRVVNSGDSIETDLETGSVTGGKIYRENSESTLNGGLGLLYRSSDQFSMRLAAYQGFRAPTLRELYYAASTRGGVILVNNPDLEPEQLIGLEAGADFDIGDSTTLRLTLFTNTVEDLIQNITRGETGDQPGVIEPCGLIGANETCRELDNVVEMQATGLEVETDYQPSVNWDFQLSYLYNDTEISKAPDNPQLVGNQVRQAPKHSFTARVRNSSRWFDTSLMARYVGERYEDDLNQLEVADFLVFDLRFSRQVSDSSELFLVVENLLDEEYEIKVENNGSIEIGRPRFVGLGLRYRY
jgi:outer membrane receptor protein involved in Fe transport